MQLAGIVLDKISMDGLIAESSLYPEKAGHEKRPMGVPAFKEWASSVLRSSEARPA